MQLYDPTKLGAPKGGIFNPREKRRLTVMLIVFVFVIGFVILLNTKSARQDAARLAALQANKEPELSTLIEKPVIDVAALESVASDERPDQRVVLPGAALDAGFKEASKIHDSVFGVLGGRELTAQIAAAIVQAPKVQRGQLLRARCTVEEMRELPNQTPKNKPRFFVRAHLEDGAVLFFAAEEFVGLAPAPGDFVRVDGLFVRVHREEVAGEWREGPLLVGPRMYESFEKLAPVKELEANAFAFVRDDSLENGFEGLNPETYWQLVSYVKNLEPGKVDWTAAPMLDDKTIQSIFRDGSAWRGKPVRLNEARMINVWRRSESEDNPLRIDHMIEGWFTRGDWKESARVARFVAPFDDVPAGVHRGMDVNLRAFFYKNLAYTKADGGLAIAPYFVLQYVEKFEQPDWPGLRQMTYIVAGSLLVLGVGIVIVLRHDKAKSAELEAELLRRRRERRGKMFPAAKA
jgi:uncharacterized protein (DUF736 family)